MRNTRRKMNKAIAGYHLLMILAAVDYRLAAEEHLVIRDYVAQEFPFRINLDREIDVLSSLSSNEWEMHFHQCMDDFYADSLPNERKNLVQFAIKLCKADQHISIEENKYLNLLFNTWFHE